MRKIQFEAQECADDLLECEKPRVFFPLTFLGGFYGGFTYAVRGGVFCNAQTANFVLCAIALSHGDWHGAFYYFIPMTAYILGIMLSEIIGNPVRKYMKMRWDTILIGIEIVIVLALGLIPDSAPYQISQIIVNFMAAMQWNTFRQAAKIPVATTFLTNHLRQIAIQFAKKIKSHGKKGSTGRALFHAMFILTFMLGVTVSTSICEAFGGKGIWFAVIPLLFLFCDLLYADKVTETSKMDIKPHGH